MVSALGRWHHTQVSYYKERVLTRFVRGGRSKLTNKLKTCALRWSLYNFTSFDIKLWIFFENIHFLFAIYFTTLSATTIITHRYKNEWKWRIGKDFEGGDPCLIKVLSRHMPQGPKENHKYPSLSWLYPFGYLNWAHPAFKSRALPLHQNAQPCKFCVIFTINRIYVQHTELTTSLYQTRCVRAIHVSDALLPGTVSSWSPQTSWSCSGTTSSLLSVSSSG
jgi:hypothetical protein